jgi:hypothetical protein
MIWDSGQGQDVNVSKFTWHADSNTIVEQGKSGAVHNQAPSYQATVSKFRAQPISGLRV